MTRTYSTRRRLLAASGAIGLTAVAGCTDAVPDGEDEDDEDGDEGEPEAEPATDVEDDPEEEALDDEAEEEEVEEEVEGEPAEDVDYEDPDGSVSFAEPEDGDEVTSPVEIVMEADDFEVESAGGEPEDGQGHLHVLVDVDCVEPGEPIPFTDRHNHFGDGETEVELDFEPGEYDLCLQASDAGHIAYDLTDEISITVVEE